MSKDITLGILYSGQLETQLIKSAKKIGGIKTIVLTDDKDGPAKHVADEFICADLSDKKVIKNFVKKIDLCTYAFENLSYEILNIINDTKTVLPSPKTLKIAQNRILEKNFANELGIKTVNWQSIKSLDDLKEVLQKAHLQNDDVLMTHLACADIPDDELNLLQFANFEKDS